MSIGNNWEWKWLDLNEPYLNKSKHAAKKKLFLLHFLYQNLDAVSINKQKNRKSCCSNSLFAIYLNSLFFLQIDLKLIDWSQERMIAENLAHIEANLTLIGMRSDTFISLFFLDQILSAEFLSRISKLFWKWKLTSIGLIWLPAKLDLSL